MHLEMNLNEVKEKSILPGGQYDAIIKGIPELKKSKESARDMLLFTIEALISQDLRETSFYSFKHYVVKHDVDGWQTFAMKQIALAFGVPFNDMGLDTEDFAGKEGRIIIEHELYKDRQQAKIVSFVVSE